MTDSTPAETREYTDWADKEAFDAIVGIRFPTEEALLHVKDDIANRFRELAAQRDHEVWMHAGCLSIAENTPGWRDASRDGWSLAMQAVAKLQDKVAELEQKASHTEEASSPKPEPATTPEDVLEKAHDAAWPFLKDLECVDRDLRWGVTGTTTRPAIKAALAAVMAELEASKNGAYSERNKVVAALARLFPSGIKPTDIPGWDPEWHGCVFIDTPEGQCSWHYHDSEAHLFADLPPYEGEWDGHSTEEKYERLAALGRQERA